MKPNTSYKSKTQHSFQNKAQLDGAVNLFYRNVLFGFGSTRTWLCKFPFKDSFHFDKLL